MSNADKLDFITKSKELQSQRAKNIKKLTKLLSIIVKTEWDIINSASKLNDDISKMSATSVANASSAIQGAISHLISTNTENITINKNDRNKINKSADISTLKRTIKNNKLMS